MYEVGEVTGSKVYPETVAHDMRNARDESGNRTFARERVANNSQIQGYFSRITVSRRKQLCNDEILENVRDDEWNENDQFHEEMKSPLIIRSCMIHTIYAQGYPENLKCENAQRHLQTLRTTHH